MQCRLGHACIWIVLQKKANLAKDMPENDLKHLRVGNCASYAHADAGVTLLRHVLQMV